MHDPIILIGYRGVGKTTIGKRVAELLKYDFIDTDEEVCRLVGTDIATIVGEEGWEVFRAYEREVLTSIAKRKGVVIATGGGAVYHRSALLNLRGKGVIFWLNAETQIIVDRLAADSVGEKQRPPLTSRRRDDEIRSILQEREPLYADLADKEIDTGRLTIDESVVRVAEIFNKRIER